MSINQQVPGRDYIGVGVGAMVFDRCGRVFLARRGSEARNEVGRWEFPGGTVSFGERLERAISREFLEEYGMQIKIVELLGIFDHILESEHQHWISVTYIAQHTRGTPEIREPKKCNKIGWFNLGDLPTLLSQISHNNLAVFSKMERGKSGSLTKD